MSYELGRVVTGIQEMTFTELMDFATRLHSDHAATAPRDGKDTAFDLANSLIRTAKLFSDEAAERLKEKEATRG